MRSAMGGTSRAEVRCTCWSRVQQKILVVVALVCVTVLFTLPSSAHAWIYAEHREIGVVAWAKLSPEAKLFFERLWQRAHFGYAAALCERAESGKRPAQGASEDRSPCIDLAAWTALAGDHACSPNELLEQTLPSYWVHDVARVSEDVRRELGRAQSEASRANLLIESSLLLQRADEHYVVRADGNNARYALPYTGSSLEEIIASSRVQGAAQNALGLYVQYHAAALELAAQLGKDPTDATSGLARRVLALEAYAAHFLQDSYAAGNVAATWGDAATRKGTHDYYDAHGYVAYSWSGRELIMFGDAHMHAEDLERSAAAVALSMAQVWHAAQNPQPTSDAASAAAHAVAALDSCNTHAQGDPLTLGPASASAIQAVVKETPIPGRGQESVTWPRYRADFGPFIGIQAGVAIGAAIGGYGGSVSRPMGEVGIGVRFGYGLEGVVASINTGAMYLDVGFVRQSEQIDLCEADCERVRRGSVELPRVPSRAGLALALRMPFWLIPGDLLVLAPLLALSSPDTLTEVALRAASGGLIPWQRTFHTSAGHMEIVLGRVVTATIYGLTERTRSFDALEDPEAGGTDLLAVGFRSVTLTFPFFEYTPLQTAAQTRAASLQVALSYGVDIPFDSVAYADGMVLGDAGEDWGVAHMLLLTLSVNGRNYL